MAIVNETPSFVSLNFSMSHSMQLNSSLNSLKNLSNAGHHPLYIRSFTQQNSQARLIRDLATELRESCRCDRAQDHDGHDNYHHKAEAVQRLRIITLVTDISVDKSVLLECKLVSNISTVRINGSFYSV